MKRLVLGGCLLLCSGCVNPSAPSCDAREDVVVAMRPLHHNIPATLPTGQVVYVCETQARTYYKGTQAIREYDHYVQDMPCPVVPID